MKKNPMNKTLLKISIASRVPAMSVVPQAGVQTIFSFVGGSVGVTFPVKASSLDESVIRSKATPTDLVFVGFQGLHYIANDTSQFPLP